MNASFSLQFGYCLLVRNFHNRSLNDRIKRLQERALCLVYKGTTSSIVELLEKENTFTINQKNIKKRALEIYKKKHKIAPKLKCELFQETETHNLRNYHTFRTYNAKTVQYGTEILLFMGPKISSVSF